MAATAQSSGGVQLQHHHPSTNSGTAGGNAITIPPPVHHARSAPTNTNSNGGSSSAHRQIIGNYELGHVLATGDFDCRTRLCTHVITGVQYVVRIYAKHVLAEAQWMWDRVAESIHVQRTLPPNKHVLEMVECFESDASVYILMHLFASMNLTKLFTDPVAQRELLGRLHVLSRATLRATAAARGAGDSQLQAGEVATPTDAKPGSARDGSRRGLNSGVSAAGGAFSNRSSFRRLDSGKWGAGASDISDVDAAQRSPYGGGAIAAGGAVDGRRGSAVLLPRVPPSPSGQSPAAMAAVHALSGPIPKHIPVTLIRVLFEQAVKGVLFLHQHNVAHTGIAPDHLLVSPEGLLRIGNMVSSCFCAPGERLHELRGTMHTVAPEVLRGEAYSPFLADAWALGVVLYFMLNRGRYPHDGANTLRHVLHGHMRPNRPGLPPIALDLLSRLLQSSPEDRLPVDAILAHPFFSASLPTVEEEVMAATSDTASPRTAGRRSLYPDYYAKPDRRPSSNTNGSGFPYENSNNSSTTSNNTLRAGSRRWRRGGNGTATDDGDTDTLTGSWYTQREQRASIFSAGSDSNNSGLLPVDLSVTEDHLDSTAVLLSPQEAAMTDHDGGDAGTRSDPLTPRRLSSFPSANLLHGEYPVHSPSAVYKPVGGSSGDWRPRVFPPDSVAGGSGGAAAMQRPQWRPELATSIDSLENLAARVIQYHFREAYRRRQYRAETRALMLQSQSKYLGSGRAGASAVVTVVPQSGGAARRPQRLSSSLASKAPLHLDYAAATSSTASSVHRVSDPPQPYPPPQHRGSLLRSPLSATPTAATASSPFAWKRKGSYLNCSSTAQAAHGSSLTPTHARWPSSVGFAASSHGRGEPNLVTIDTTRAGSILSGSFERGGDSPDGVESLFVAGKDLTEMDLGAGSGAAGRSTSTGAAAAARTGSFTLPSLTPTPRTVELPGDNSSTGATSLHRSISGSRSTGAAVATPGLVSQQQARRRSTMSVVLSTVPPGRASQDRTRGVGGANTVSEFETCPLCHREPFAIRSIVMRPYAATPYVFNGGGFQKLLQ